MDQLDKMIIMDLLQNCRQSYQALSQKHSVTLNEIENRIEKILADGVLEFCLEPNVAVIEGDWAIAFVTTSGNEDQESFIREIGENEMINEVGTLSGSCYIIYAVYSGGQGFSEFTKFLRSQDLIQKIEVHQLLMVRGKKIKLSRKQLTVLHCIIDYPIMKLNMIADCTGYSTKAVNKILNGLMESEGLWFGGRLNLNAAEGTAFFVKIEWDEMESDLDEIIEWLSEEIFDEFWAPLISTSKPIIYAAFLVDSEEDINPIVEKIRNNLSVKSATSIVGKTTHSFHDLRRYWIDEKFIKAGLEPTFE